MEEYQDEVFEDCVPDAEEPQQQPQQQVLGQDAPGAASPVADNESESEEAAAERIREALQRYDEARLRGKKAGLNMTLPKQVNPHPLKRHGHIRGVRPGDRFADRGQLYVANLHTTVMKGIHAPGIKEAAFEKGAYSVVLSGGYRDDEDMGQQFWYTGEGGMDGGRQVRDQTWTGSNAALRNNCNSRTPVRVIRGFKHKGDGAPVEEAGGEGEGGGGGAGGKAEGGGDKAAGKGFVYEGLYNVLEYRHERSKDGPMVCRFLMEGVQGESRVTTKVDFGIFNNALTTHSLHSKRLAGGAGGLGLGQSPGDLLPAKRKRISRERQQMLNEIRLLHGAALLNEDITGGLEKVPIPLVNEVNSERLPESFTYIKEYKWAPGVHQLAAPVLQFADEEMAGFMGTAPSRPGKRRADGASAFFSRAPPPRPEREVAVCGIAFNRRMCELDRSLPNLPPGYDPHGEEQYNGTGCLMVTDPCGLHECDRTCTSERCCNNMQLSNGVVFPLEVFMTAGGAKGWGVRCRDTIPAGAFVCGYVGQLVTDAMAEARKGADHYLFDLDFFAHIYTEISQKGVDSIRQEIPLHKIPPMPSVGLMRQLLASAADAARQQQQQAGAQEQAAGPAAGHPGNGSLPGTSGAGLAGDPAGGLQQSASAAGASAGGGGGGAAAAGSCVDEHGVLVGAAAVQLAAAELAAACSAAAEEELMAEGGAEGLALGSQPSVDIAEALLTLHGQGGGAGAKGALGSPAAARPAAGAGAGGGGAGAAGGGSGAAALAAVSAAAAAATERDPGAFYLQPVFHGDMHTHVQEGRGAAGAGAGGSGAQQVFSEPLDDFEYAPLVVIDARNQGNVGRFINHSCDPNLTIQAVFAGSYRNTLLYHVGLYSLKDIEPGTELTYNYGYAQQASRAGMYGMQCNCGAPNCVGQLM